MLAVTFQITKTTVCLGGALKDKTFYWFSEWAEKDYLKGFLESAKLPGKDKPEWKWQEMPFRFPAKGEYQIFTKP